MSFLSGLLAVSRQSDSAGMTYQRRDKVYSGAHKVVDLLSGLLVLEADSVVSPHDAIACPFAHSSAQVGLVAFAHGTLGAEGLHACNVLSLAA